MAKATHMTGAVRDIISMDSESCRELDDWIRATGNQSKSDILVPDVERLI